MSEPQWRAVISTLTARVKRWGYCDFENSDDFDNLLEEVIETTHFDFGIEPQTWYWDDAGQEFTQTPPLP